MIEDSKIALETPRTTAGGDILLKTGAGKVYWVTASAGATGGAFQLNDSIADGGTDRFDITMPASSMIHINFDPPIRFTTGIFLDIPGTNLTINVGHD